MDEPDIKILKKRFGDNLKRIREIHNISQKQLAFEINKDHTTISRIERGLLTPSLITLFEIADVLNIEVEELVRI